MRNNIRHTNRLLLLIAGIFISVSLHAQGFEGYYRYPDISGDLIVFTSEGDLWSVPITGGLARRLTTHPEVEQYPKISPDGSMVAFTASYEGPNEVYTLPVEGGLTTRWTFEQESSEVCNWTPDGKLAYQTWAFSRVPDQQVVVIDPETKTKSVLPLSQASEASFDASGTTVYFVRPADHNNVTKRYQGGTARQIWKFTEGSEEAVKLTTDHPGESHHPEWYEGRIYFITDRDGIMNVWSMDEEGNDLIQHTQHETYDVTWANVSDGRIVYQNGADLWLYDIAKGTGEKLEITLASDLDQLREKWEDNPSQYITSVHPDPKGEKVVITARGRLFVAPAKKGRFISITDKNEVRYRDAVFSHDGEDLIVLSDETGEFEFVKIPAEGIGEEQQITSDGDLLRYGGSPSLDGKYIAYSDLEANMYVLNVATGESRKISTNQEGIWGHSWAPDSKWLAYVQAADNTMARIFLYHVENEERIALTTDRANSIYPQFSPDGKFIYFISDRSFTSLVGSPWGPRQPEPYFDASEKIYHISLKKGTRSPFRPDDELYKEDKNETEKEKKKEKGSEDDKVVVGIDREGIQERIREVPVKPGNYYNLAVNDKALYFVSRETGVNAKSHLAVVKIDNEDPKVETMTENINGFEMTLDGKKLLVRKSRKYYMVDAGTGKISDLSQSKIDLSGWKFPITPRADWKQIYTDAWRMERDYFYDKDMHGVDWDAMYDKYLPLVDRVTTRNELSDVIGKVVGELSALHTSVRGGDLRTDKQNVPVASLGAEFSRDEAAGGYRIEYIYQGDPDYPEVSSPLDDPLQDIAIGDIITHINGKPALESVDIAELIRNEAGRQVRISVKRGEKENEFIVTPISSEWTLRYRDWEYNNRRKVDRMSDEQIGYLHLRAMGSNDLSQFYREFYPVFDRPGLIVDVRYNWGGNIDSFILEKLLRKAWMYWKGRSGQPTWNMQYAFRGHIVVLVNENTYSDGEAFADGFKKLGLGTTIGMRTWGGEIWLSSANRLSDGGIARAPMFGVYGENGEWLIEGHGFVPDIELDNLPHETYKGKDAQLERAVEFLQEKIAEDPREVPPVPDYPDKSFNNGKNNE